MLTAVKAQHRAHACSLASPGVWDAGILCVFHLKRAHTQVCRPSVRRGQRAAPAVEQATTGGGPLLKGQSHSPAPSGGQAHLPSPSWPCWLLRCAILPHHTWTCPLQKHASKNVPLEVQPGVKHKKGGLGRVRPRCPALTHAPSP